MENIRNMMDSFTLEEFCTLFHDIIAKEECNCQNPEVFQVVPSCTNSRQTASTTMATIHRQSDDINFRIGYSTFSITLAIFGLLANGYILSKPGRKWKELANSQRLIIYLAITNLFYTINFLIPSTSNLWSTSWQLGDPLCKLFMCLTPVGASVSVGFVAIIAYERFVGITKPLAMLTNQKITCLSVTNIIISFGSTIPNFLYAGLRQNGKCEHKWPSDEFALIYNILYLLIPIFTPLVTTVVFYFRINKTLTKAVFKDNFLQDSIQKKSYELKIKQTIKIGKIIRTIIVTFIIMVPPYQICYITLLVTGYVNMTLFKILTFVSIPIYQAHVALHPFLFGGMHKEVRRWIRSICRKTRRSLGVSKASYVVTRSTVQTTGGTEESCLSDSSRTNSFNG